MPDEPKDYGEYLETVGEMFNIYDGPEVWLSGYKAAPEEAKHLYAANWCVAEVCNGGYHQFFWNSTGVLAPEALTGFEVLGLPDMAALTKRAMGFFGVNYPRGREERQDAMEAYEGSDGEEHWDAFDAFDAEFYRLLSTAAGDFQTAADTYLASSADGSGGG